MNVLDDYFGPSQIRSDPAKQPVRTNWPTQPEHIRPILDLWDELRGEVHSVQSKKQRVHGARQWYEENRGQALELLKRANRYAEDRMLDVTSPGSLLFYAIKHKPKPALPTPKFPCEDCQTGVDYPTKDNPTSCPKCGLEYEWEAQHE